MENDLPPDVAEQFKGLEARTKVIEAARAERGTPSLLTQAVEAKDSGYLPEMVAGGTALATAKYLHGKSRSTYYEGLKAVRAAADTELKMIKKLQTTQPFEKSGVKVVNQPKSPAQKTRLLKSGNRAVVPYESGAKSTLSNVRGASSPVSRVVRAGTAGQAAVAAVREYSDGTGYLTHEVSPAKPAVAGTPEVRSNAISNMTNAQKKELAKEISRKRMTRALGSGYGKFVDPVLNPRVTGVDTRGKGKTRTNITVTAEELKAGKANIPPKLSAAEAAKAAKAASAAGQELNFAQKALRWGGNVLSSPWVQRPLTALDVGTRVYGMPQRYRDEVALMEAERNGAPSSANVLRSVFGSDSAIRPYLASGAAIPRIATNFYTGYVPEMIGMYDMPEDLGNMYKGFSERDQSEFIKKTGRPMTEQELAAQQEAMWMSTIGIGG